MQLQELQERDPGLAGRVVQQIDFQLPFWEPGLEDRSLIRHVRRISKDCGYRIYRLKEPRSIGGLRIFFFELNLTKPRRRLVATMIERASDDKTYDDPAQPHCVHIRQIVQQQERDGRLTRRR
jgi:hypothetical protein